MPAEAMTWVLPIPPVKLSEKLEYSMASPLFTASVLFERTLIEGGWSARMQGALKLPLGKKGTATAQSTWHNGGKTYVKYQELGMSPTEWVYSPAGLSCLKFEKEPVQILNQEKIDALGGAVLGATDVLFGIADAWKEIGSQAGMVFSLGSRIFALLLLRKSEVEIEARGLPINFLDQANESVSEIFARLPWPEAKVADLEWSEEKRTIGAIRSRVPMLGHVRIQLVNQELS